MSLERTTPSRTHQINFYLINHFIIEFQMWHLPMRYGKRCKLTNPNNIFKWSTKILDSMPRIESYFFLTTEMESAEL